MSVGHVRVLGEPPVRTMAPLDAAWSAGLFEGEGHVSTKNDGKSTHRRYIRVIVQMADEDVIRKLQARTGVGRIATPRPKTLTAKQLYRWEVTTLADCQYLFDQWFQHLGIRRRDAFATALKEAAWRSP